ncbi:MAG: hypothetical protein DHS80DRAFT_20963 [Piptocephalis tieghemiana]|nr:MAG: hypothetical protein DHS80DRAFT_20963 [Piptocephalis tieghemiana]
MSWRLEKRNEDQENPWIPPESLHFAVASNDPNDGSGGTSQTLGSNAGMVGATAGVAVVAVALLAIGAFVVRRRRRQQAADMEKGSSSGRGADRQSGENFYSLPDAVVLPSPLTELPPNSPFRKDFTPPRASRAGAALQGRGANGPLNKVVGHRSVQNATSNQKQASSGLAAPPISASRGFVMAQAPRRPSWRPGQDTLPPSKRSPSTKSTASSSKSPPQGSKESKAPASTGPARADKTEEKKPAEDASTAPPAQPLPQSPARFW